MTWTPILQPKKKEWTPILPKSNAKPVLAKENQVQKDPYFYGTTTRGHVFGRADESDTSGRPYLAYRKPGDTATTTDYTRTATKWNPILSVKTPREEVANPRGVANEQALKQSLNYKKGDNLDHKMALAVSGSNHPENLRVVPAKQNKDGSTASSLSSAVQEGKKSLFHAQTDFALSKKLPPPVTGSRYGAFKAEALKAEEESRKANSIGGLLKNALKASPKALVDTLKSIGQVSNRASSAGATGLHDIGTKVLGTVAPNLKPILQANRPVLTPQTQFQKDLYGTDKAITPTSAGRELRMAKDPNAKSTGLLGKIDPALGLFAGLADAVPGGQGAKKGVQQGIKAGIRAIEEVKGILPKAKQAARAKTEFSVGDVLDPQGNTNMVGKVTIREVKGNTLKFVDSEGTEFYGMQRSLVRDLVNGGSWKKSTNDVVGDALRANEARLMKEGWIKPSQGSNPVADIYKNTEKADEVIGNLWGELDMSQAGFRVHSGYGVDHSVSASPSTFPKWIPEELRSSKLFEQIKPTLESHKLEMPPASKPKLRRLYNLLLDRADRELGIDTKAIRDDIIKSNDTSTTRKTGTATGSNRSPAGSQRLRTTSAGANSKGGLTNAPPSQSTASPQGSARTGLLSQRGKQGEILPIGGRKEGMLSKQRTSPLARSSDTALDKPYSPDKQKASVFESLKRAKTSVIEYVQNSQERVRQLTNRKDVKIDDASNPYLKETLYHGRLDTKIKVAEKETKEIINDLKVNKLSREEVSDYLKFRHAPERNLALGDRAAGVSTKEAGEGLARLQSSPNGAKLGEISDRVQKLNNQTLELLKDSGVISDELFSKLRTRYKNHIPLNRIMENTDDFEGALSGKGFDVRSTGIKRAVGSEREVSDILGNVVHNYEQAVLRSEKNIVDQATLNFARNNKDVLGDLFRIRKPQAIGQTFDGKPLLEKTDDPKILQMFENGKKVWIEVSDPHLATALRGIGREKLGGLMNVVAQFTRFYSGLSTRFNPEFALPNKLRDLQETAVYMASQKGFKSAAGVVTKDSTSIKDVLSALRGESTEGARLYNEMKSLGGTTGGMGLSTRSQVQLNIEHLEKLANSKTRRIGNNLVEYVDNWNTLFEDSTRLSVYKQALKDGLSKEKAAFLAKEASINFNRMGKGGPVINALYMFANASIQGSTKMMRAMKNPKVLGGTMLAVGGSVAAVSEWNDRVDPNWRDKVTKWDRMNSLPIMIPSTEGEAKYITIPVSWGLKPIKIMADHAYLAMSGKDFSTKEMLEDTTSAILNAYNPVGGTDVTSALVPTVLDTPVDIARNQAWHGGMIRPDYGQPKDIQYFDSLGDTKTGQASISISEMLQSKAGIAVSPADIKYGFDAYVGGAGRTVSKTANLFGGLLTSQKVPLDEYPLLSRFYRERTAEEVESSVKRTEKESASSEVETREKFQDKNRVRPIYDQVQGLLQSNPVEAQQMVEDMTPEDYEIYKRIRTGERAKRTETLRTYLNSNPTRAVEFLRSQSEEEQTRLLKVMTDEEYAIYNSAKQ